MTLTDDDVSDLLHQLHQEKQDAHSNDASDHERGKAEGLGRARNLIKEYHEGDK